MAKDDASTFFRDTIDRGTREGKLPARTQEARVWYREAARGKRLSEGKLISSAQSRQTMDIKVGSMYLFQYDPKYKDTLPYYDRVPLIFPIEKVPGGFYGINLHYLPLQLRAKLMDALYTFSNNKKYDETTKIMLSYKLLKATSSLKYYVPCLNRYLYSHMKSKFMYIHPTEWDIALFLPLAKFEKHNANYVQAASRRIINAYN